MKILVLAYNEFSFTNKENGKCIEGLSLEYLQNATNESNKCGYFPLKVTVDKKELINIPSVPAFYNVDISMVSGQNRKATVNFNNFKFLKDFDIKLE